VELAVEPGAGVNPVAFGGGDGNAQELRGLRHGQAGEVAELDQPCLDGIRALQLLQGLVQRQKGFGRILLGRGEQGAGGLANARGGGGGGAAVRPPWLRWSRRLSRAALARAAGISKGYLSEIESADPGKAVRPSAEVLYRIASALGTSVADLLEKDVRPVPHEISPSLRVFVEKNHLPEEDVQMLADIRFRGNQPVDERDWAFLYDAIQRSIRG